MQVVCRSKKKLTLIAQLLYLIFSALYIVGSIIDQTWLRIFKIFPLAILLIKSCNQYKNKQVMILMLAVVLGSIGDLVLQYSGKNLFSLGAAFFLLGHICYSSTILQSWKDIDLKVLVQRKMIVMIGNIVVLSVSFVNLATTITDQIKEQQGFIIPLLCVYLVVLSLNCVNAFVSLCGKSKVCKQDLLMSIGSVSFLISDNVLGKSIFGDWKIFGSHQGNSVLIMVSYYVAQYLMFNSGYRLSIERYKEEIKESLIENKNDTDQ